MSKPKHTIVECAEELCRFYRNCKEAGNIAHRATFAIDNTLHTRASELVEDAMKAAARKIGAEATDGKHGSHPAAWLAVGFVKAKQSADHWARQMQTIDRDVLHLLLSHVADEVKADGIAPAAEEIEVGESPGKAFARHIGVHDMFF